LIPGSAAVLEKELGHLFAYVSIYIGEYLSRKSLAQMGFHEPLENLDCITADALLLIEETIFKAQAEKQKRDTKKG
jgi:hypothetical protein